MQPPSIQVREFKAKLSHYLALAGKGQPLRIRSHNTLIAEVTGVPPDRLSNWLLSGAASWSGGKSAGAALALSAGGTLSGQVVDNRGCISVCFQEGFMTRPSTPKLEITVSRSDKMLAHRNDRLRSDNTAHCKHCFRVCEDTGTPVGVYKAGKWIKDKTNSTHGPTPWSRDPWGNPYGPFFLPLNDAKTGKYTTYGIHGTRGPRAGNFEKPPLPQGLMSFFVGDDEAKFLYCSHGCVRVSNPNISKIFELTTQPKYAGTTISVTIK